jgi:hypothetical protein
MTSDLEMKFYEKIKASIVIRKVGVPGQEQPPRTSKALVDQMKEFESAILSNKQVEIYMKCLIGRNLKLIHNRMKGRELNHFLVNHGVTTYSSSHIYFLMNLYETAMEYNRLMYTTMSIRELKSRFKLIKKLLALDPDYWKCCDVL